MHSGGLDMIPKIIHFCWLSEEAFPKKIQRCMNSWKRMLPDYTIIHWNTKNFDVNCNAFVKQAYECGDYAFVADYVRFYALFTMGGIYLDSDVEVLDSFDELLRYKSFFGYEYTGLPDAAVIGAEKGTEWLKFAIDWYEMHSFFYADGTRNRIIAPLVLKYAFERGNSLKLCDDEQVHEVDGMVIMPYEYFSPKNGFSGMIYDSEKTICIHHFNSAWLKPGITRKIKKVIHLMLIKFFGKTRYNKYMYFCRPQFKRL